MEMSRCFLVQTCWNAPSTALPVEARPDPRIRLPLIIQIQPAAGSSTRVVNIYTQISAA